MILGLQDLVAPLSPPQFWSLLRARRLSHLSRVQNADQAALLSWDGLRAVIAEPGFAPESFRLMRNSKELSPVFYTSAGRYEVAKLDALLASGASIIFTHVERHVPDLGRLRDALECETGEKVTMSVVVTTGADAALKIHYDVEDLFILQLEGSKRWFIRGPEVPHPAKEMTKRPPPTGAPFFDEVLEQGDVLVMPSGNWHHCENRPGRSVHLAVMFEPPSGWQMLKPLIRELLEEEDFRRPLTRLENEGAVTAVEDRLKRHLHDMIGRISLRDFLAEKSKPPE